MYDIETSLMVVTAFQLKTEYIPHTAILQDWNILSAAWKYLGDKEVKAVSVGQDVTDDRHVCETLRKVIADADIIVHHNGDKFDLKKLNARLIYHDLLPLPPKATVDTLKEAKKVAYFTSNRLDYLGKALCGRGKVHTDPELWLNVLRGDMDALDEMVEYNKADVEVLELVYQKLRSYMPSHPHVGVLLGNDRKCSCPKCGSTELQKDGVRITAAGLKQQAYKCSNCGGYSRVPFTPIGN